MSTKRVGSIEDNTSLSSGFRYLEMAGPIFATEVRWVRDAVEEFNDVLGSIFCSESQRNIVHTTIAFDLPIEGLVFLGRAGQVDQRGMIEDGSEMGDRPGHAP